MDPLPVVSGFLAAAVRVATPLLWAATGETITERSGVINLGVEGAMLAGALGAAVGASGGGVWVGTGVALAAGLLVGVAFALVAVTAQADQIISGTAVTLGAIGLTGVIYREYFGTAGAGLSLPTLPPLRIPILAEVPLLGPALFAQPILTYAAIGIVPIVWLLVYRTRWGLVLRAVGESREAARVAGVHVGAVRFAATVAGSGLAGLGGASLVLAQVGTFAEQMTAGRGFVAIAIVVLGRWHPFGVMLAALLFGAANASQYLFQAMSLDVPYQVFLMLPYFLTIVALAGVVGQVRAPAELGK